MHCYLCINFEVHWSLNGRKIVCKNQTQWKNILIWKNQLKFLQLVFEGNEPRKNVVFWVHCTFCSLEKTCSTFIQFFWEQIPPVKEGIVALGAFRLKVSYSWHKIELVPNAELPKNESAKNYANSNYFKEIRLLNIRKNFNQLGKGIPWN